MAITLRCPNSECGHTAIVADFFRSRAVRCSHCNQTFQAPDNDDSPKGLARFEVRAPLGSGAFGDVFRAYDTQLQREIALKVPRAGIIDNPRQIERFLREGRAAAALHHPNIVPVYDAGQDGETYFLAAAFVEGRTLAQALDGSRYSPRRAATLVRLLAEALAYAHQQGIVHRDVKPANILLDADGEPHLTDFGLAYRLDAAQKLTTEGSVMGTPAYMAPEQAIGKWSEVKPSVDQYALGVILFELLTGQTPFHGSAHAVMFQLIHEEPPTPREKDARIPRDLETICLKAMARVPENRYPDCQALADDLRRWLDGEPIRARPVHLGGRLLRWMKREPKLVALGGVIISCLLVVGIVAAEKSAELELTRLRTDDMLSMARVKAREASRHALEAYRKAQQADHDAQEAVKAQENAAKIRAEARKAQQDQEKQADTLEKALTEARKEERERREKIYKARLTLAEYALGRGDKARALALLRLDIPADADTADIRTQEWFTLWSQAGG